MTELIKKAGRQWALVLFVVTVLFSSGVVYATHLRLCKEIDCKLDKDIYEKDRKILSLEIQLQLDRIERKIDGISLAKKGVEPVRN